MASLQGKELKRIINVSQQTQSLVVTPSPNSKPKCRMPVSSLKGCKCEQEQKVVVFVGCTQNGKSSMIRSIFKYGGYTDEAQKVEVGSGNSSTTKEVSSYKVVIDIKQHFLKDSAGKILDVEKDTELYEEEYEPGSRPTGQHIHLLMLDTPGLDDSDNSIEAEKRSKERGDRGRSQMKTVDETHKLAVLKALGDIPKVHSVCFVLSLENTLGNATQDLTRQYMEIFEQCKLNASYHFAHTYVNVENMFEDKAVNRPFEIGRTFGIKPGQAKHHRIDNLPIEDDPISVHFANLAISELLGSLAKEKGQPTSKLRYPKSAAHRSTDQGLQQSLDILERSWEKELSELRTSISSLQSSKRPLNTRKSVQHSNYTEARARYDNLNTTDLVEINRQYLRDDAHLFSSVRLHFNVSSKAPIREYKLSPAGSATWYGPYGTVIGTNNCSATLKAEWGNSASGTITLMGWKKEHKADELQKAKEEKDETWEEYSSTVKEIEEIDEKIKSTESSIGLLQQKLKDLLQDRKFAKLDYIPMSKIKTNGAYFSRPGFLCYAFGQGAARMIPQLLLHSDYSSIPWPKFRSHFDGLDEEVTLLLEICREMLAAVGMDFQRKNAIKNSLVELKRLTADEDSEPARQIQSAKMSPYRGGTRKSQLDSLSVEDRAEARKHLGILHWKLKSRIDGSIASFNDNLAEEAGRLGERRKLLDVGIARIEGQLKISRKLESKWREEELGHRATQSSIEAIGKVLKGSMASLAVFTVLRIGMAEGGPTSQTPWDLLIAELREFYLCDPKRFKEIKVL